MQYFLLILALAKLLTAEFFYKPFPNEELVRSPGHLKLPWMGILRVRLTPPMMDGVANVILIAKKVALSNAHEIRDLDEMNKRNTTYVNFFNNKNVFWKCYVKDYMLHPEFHSGRHNTIGLILLESTRAVLDTLWKPISWPKTYFNPKEVVSIFTVGFTDQRTFLEQVVYKMDSVDFINCTNTYMKEGLSFPTIWPKYYTCFRAHEQVDTCVYDSGMAAASNATGEWILIGISIYGPGCSFPARFIEFYPYVPWLRGVLKTMLPEEIQKAREPEFTPIDEVRRFNPIGESRRFITQEDHKDLDSDIMKNIDDATIVMESNETNKEIDVYGKCHDRTIKIYAEEGFIRLYQDLEGTVALYSVTIALYQLKLICIRTTVICERKSKTKVFMKKGFDQEDLHLYIQQVPEYRIGTKEYEKRVLFLKGEYLKMERMPTVTIWFKFEVKKNASIKIAFYGEHAPPTPPPDVDVARTRRPRPRYSTRNYASFNRKHNMANWKAEDNIQQEYYEPNLE